MLELTDFFKPTAKTNILFFIFSKTNYFRFSKQIANKIFF